MGQYRLFFVLFTLSEIVFSLVYYFIKHKLDSVLMLGALIYLGGIIVGYIAYRVSKYNQKRKKLLDNLPG
jgi:divalent metal cation (Fe/Co/Zn/Cd) transporter